MLTEKQRETLASLSVALLVDARYRLGLPETHLDPGIRPTTPFARMVGTAVTGRLEAVANAPFNALVPLVASYRSVEQPSSIAVIQVPPELHNQAIFGDGSAMFSRKHGFVGALVEGGVRDTAELRDMQFPVFSRTIAPGFIIGKAAVAAVGEPVLIGGRSICNGDVIAADNDGVVVIRPAELDGLIDRAAAIQQWEHQLHSMVANGTVYEEALEAVGPMP